MLKKAGIVVTAAALGVLAVSPLAFAGEDEDGGINILNITNTTAQINPQICNNQVLSGVAAALLGKAKAEASNEGKCKQDNSVENG